MESKVLLLDRSIWELSRLAGSRGVTGATTAASSRTRAFVERLAAPLDLVVPDRVPMSRARGVLRGLCPSGTAAGRSRALVGANEIGQRLRCDEPLVLHSCIGPTLHRPAYLRCRHSARMFPTTVAQYGISYRVLLLDSFLPAALVPTYACDSVICISTEAQRSMERLLGSLYEDLSSFLAVQVTRPFRLDLIPDGVDADVFRPRSQSEARRDLDLPPERPIVLCLGRFSPYDKMDLEPLLLAWESLLVRLGYNRPPKEQGPSSRLPDPLMLLVGTDSYGYVQHLRAICGTRGLDRYVSIVVDPPAVSVPLLYSASDVFVSLSDTFESLGMAVMEAMACEIPVVVSDLGGYKDLVVHGETGFRVPTYWARCDTEICRQAVAWDILTDHLLMGQSIAVDLVKLQDYIAALLADEPLRERMGKKGRERVLKHFSTEAIVPQHEQLWTELEGVARSIPPVEGRRLAYFEPRYFDHFSNFASSILSGTELIGLSARGKDGTAERLTYPLFPAVEEYIDRGVLTAIVRTLRFGGFLYKSFPLDEVVDEVSARQKRSREDTLRHVMWLLKYGFVELRES